MDPLATPAIRRKLSPDGAVSRAQATPAARRGVPSLLIAQAAMLMQCVALPSSAAGAGGGPEADLFGQFTAVGQYHPSFASPYRGANSLDPGHSGKETTDLTLYAGVSLWKGASLYANPEVDQGFGLSDTLGAAGFPSGEAYKVGANSPYLRLPRLFVRQTFDLSGEPVKLESAPNRLAGSLAADNVVLTIGKFSVVDLFDTNTYAHDPRTDFLNWAIVDAGAFDYAADAWGYTYGAAAEWTQNRWTLRAGLFALSEVPNSKNIDRGLHQFAVVAEAEERFEARGRPGKAKLLLFVDRGRFARYGDAVALARGAGGIPDAATARRYASRPGIVLNFEQQIADDLGAFLRASANDGSKEAIEFTEINRSLSLGLALQGHRWQRPGDTVGVAAVVNDISNAARAYFAAGGMGILIGDGRLPRYGAETIFETYYSAALAKSVSASVDYQYIANPAYSRERGPVSVFGARLHVEF